MSRIWNNTRNCNSTQLVPAHPGRPSTPSDAAVHLVEHFRASETRQMFQILLAQLPAAL